MKFLALAMIGCLPHLALQAAPASRDIAGLDAPLAAEITHDLKEQVRLASAAKAVKAHDAPVYVSRMARAIGQAAKKGVVESSVAAYSEVLIDCQKSQLSISTTPLMRSDSQQAHCYRY